jgi:hypothetical protein
MSSTIIGTFPIFNSQNSAIDEFGIQTLNYNFTIKAEDAQTYIPNKDDEYYGPDINGLSGLYDPRTSANHSEYRVTQVSTNNLPGGLMEITVTTVGTLNIYTPPKVRLVPQCPLAYGIQGVVAGAITELEYPPKKSPSVSRVLGYGISVTFLTQNDPASEGFVFQNYFNSIMPTSIYNTFLPSPARTPYSSLSSRLKIEGDGNSAYTIVENYSGFICNDNAYERIGGVTKFTLIYKETFAQYQSTYQKQNDGSYKYSSTGLVYSFP